MSNTTTKYVYKKSKTCDNAWIVSSIVTYNNPKSMWQTGEFKNYICTVASEFEAKKRIEDIEALMNRIST